MRNASISLRNFSSSGSARDIIFAIPCVFYHWILAICPIKSIQRWQFYLSAETTLLREEVTRFKMCRSANYISCSETMGLSSIIWNKTPLFATLSRSPWLLRSFCKDPAYVLELWNFLLKRLIILYINGWVLKTPLSESWFKLKLKIFSITWN